MRNLALGLALLPGMLLAQETTPLSDIPLRPDAGGEVGLVFETWLSPHQEGGEEEEAPRLAPEMFLSTAPSVPRDQRPSHGHGTLSFTQDLSRAVAHVAIEGVDIETIAMFHIHCGRPGILGPIIVDFSHSGDLQEMFADGVLTVEITNDDLEAVVDHGHGLVGILTDGCPIMPVNPLDRVGTIAGLAQIALQGELYYNLHTDGQMYFGDMRGQLHRVD